MGLQKCKGDLHIIKEISICKDASLSYTGKSCTLKHSYQGRKHRLTSLKQTLGNNPCLPYFSWSLSHDLLSPPKSPKPLCLQPKMVCTSPCSNQHFEFTHLWALPCFTCVMHMLLIFCLFFSC